MIDEIGSYYRNEMNFQQDLTQQRLTVSIAELRNLMDTALLPSSMITRSGSLTGIGPKGLRANGLSKTVSLGEFVKVNGSSSDFLAEVVQLDFDEIVAKPLDQNSVAHLGDRVIAIGAPRFYPCEMWKGRIISALGEPLDGKGPLPQGLVEATYNAKPPPATDRAVISNRLMTGVKTVDIFTPLCYGQRMGVFAGSGVGKSTLMGMLCRATGFDCVVVGLIGERGREVNEFVREVLGETLLKAVVVVSTGDEAASLRKRAALLATSIAESFRDKGQNVLLIMDSITRFAQALRELALAGGEPPVSRGFPPSVFSTLPQMLERAGPGLDGSGTITGIYSVLVDGDNHNEPISDAIRGTLDGHIILDRNTAASGRYPAIDLLGSISRLINKALTIEELRISTAIRSMVIKFEETKDLRAFGGYQPGKDLELDRAVIAVPKLYAVLNQKPDEQPCMDPFPMIQSIIGAMR